MSVPLRRRHGILLICLSLALGAFGSEVARAQLSPVVVSQASCGCDDWSCPLCQEEACDAHPIPGMQASPWNATVEPPVRYQPPFVPQPTPPDPFVDDDSSGVPELPAVTPATPNTPSRLVPGPALDPSTIASPGSLGPDSVGTGNAPQLAFSEQSAAFGGRRLSVPDMIGPFFGPTGGQSVLLDRSSFSVLAQGFTVSGFTFDENASLVYETSTSTNPNDFFSLGVGRFEDGDLVFDVTEPIPPNDAPTSPSPDHSFDGGTARLANGGTSFMDGDLWRVDYSFSRPVLVEIPLATSTVVGQMRIAENTNPRPRDRVFMNYSLFDGVRLLPGGVTVNRFSPGFEKTFWNGDASFEMRFPFATTLSSNIVLDAPDLGKLEFGDLYMVGKFLMLDTGPFAFSAGLAVTIPTADDNRVFLDGAGGRVELARVNNESIHLMPFVGCVRERGRAFSIAFAQLDFDATGNEVMINPTGDGLVHAGKLQEATYAEFNWSMGYWLLDRSSRRHRLTRFAPMGEIHYRRSLDNSDFVRRGAIMVGSDLETVDYLGAVAGGVFQFGRSSRLTVGYTTMIGNDTDQQFDGELRAFWNQYF